MKRKTKTRKIRKTRLPLTNIQLSQVLTGLAGSFVLADQVFDNDRAALKLAAKRLAK